MAKGQNKTGLKVFLSIIVVLLSVVLVAGIAATAYFMPLLSDVNRVDYSTEPTKSSSEIEDIMNQLGITEATGGNEEEEPQEPAPTIPKDYKTYNILIVGQDQRNPGDAKLSDTMILCTINTEKKTLTMTSFLRDMYVKLPDYNGMKCGRNRINVNYALGGMGMLDQCLLENFGIKVDHNVEVDFSAFKTIVDMMDGVDIELTHAEVQYMNASGLGKSFKTGLNHLNGESALVYARIRKIDNDFYRTSRQRTVLTKLLEKCKTLSIAQLNDLVKAVVPLITTDMENSDITRYVLDVLPIVRELTVVTQSIPADGTYEYANMGTEEQPMYVILPDIEKNRKILEETLS